MKIVRERKQQCPAYSSAVSCDAAQAAARLPAHGVPAQVSACAQEVEGSQNAPVRLQGPASKVPDVGKLPDAGGESEEESESDHAHDATVAEEHLQAAEVSIALDPVHDLQPVKMMQALQGNIDALQSYAAKVLRNEKQARIQDKDGVLQPVVDEGGREGVKV